MKPALLVIDVQKQFCEPGEPAAESIQDAIRFINFAIALFREKDLPIICIQHVSEEGHLVRGEEGFELPEELAIEPSDPHIHKTYGNAFNKTSLADDLEALGVDTVIVTGFCAEHCVLSTYRGALDLDLTPIVLRGALASYDRDHIRFVEEIGDVISYGALEKVLG